MASGDLLLELRNSKQYENLPKRKSFGNIPVTITPHRSMNTVRLKHHYEDLLNIWDRELFDGWKEQNVVMYKE